LKWTTGKEKKEKRSQPPRPRKNGGKEKKTKGATRETDQRDILGYGREKKGGLDTTPNGKEEGLRATNEKEFIERAKILRDAGTAQTGEYIVRRKALPQS